MNDLNILHGTVVRPEGCFAGGVEVKDGTIVRVLREDEAPDPARETVDAGNMLIFPGMIDSHVHIRGGRLEHREDFASGTMAAAAGGVTTVLEMPVTMPPASRSGDFINREKEVKARAYVDYALYGGAGADNLEEIPLLAQAGAVGYKTFLMPPVPGREKEFFGLCSQTQEILTQVMEQVAKTGLMLAVHSELNQYVEEETRLRMERGENGLKAFCRSRPVKAETEAVKWVIAAARKTGCRASICHVSTPEAAALIQEARAQGVDIHGETCPQYLLFNEDTAERAGVFARMKPPLRDAGRMARLRELYREGALEITGSDHAPYLREEKLRNGQDIWRTFDGVPGLELSLPLLVTAAERGELTYESIARNTAENTARLFGLPQKGRIEEGRDADLVLVERLQLPQPLDIGTLFTKSRDSAELYRDLPLRCRVAAAYVRGRRVFADGAITGEQGWGKFVSPV